VTLGHLNLIVVSALSAPAHGDPTLEKLIEPSIKSVDNEAQRVSDEISRLIDPKAELLGGATLAIYYMTSFSRTDPRSDEGGTQKT